MKPATIFMIVLLPAFLSGSEPCISKAQQHLSLGKVVLQLDERLSSADAELFFEKSGWLDAYTTSIRLDYPRVIIARLKNPARDYSGLDEILQKLNSQTEVVFANPVLANGKEEVSVLAEVFVKTGGEIEKNLLQELAGQLNFKISGAYRYGDDILILTPAENATLNSLELSCRLAELNRFEYVHPNFLFSPVVATNDPIFVRQWNLMNEGTAIQGSGTPGADMSVEEAWTVTRGDTSIKIAILDSGVDTLHPDLIGNLLPGFDATGGGSNGYPNTKYPNDGHGTCCAGIVAATADNAMGIAGVAPLCKIIPVKIFYYVDTAIGTTDLGIIPYSTTQWMADGINWAAQNDADVMSNSWGVPAILFSILPGPVSLVEDAIDNALLSGRNGKGIPQLFSTGNENGAAPIWPSSLAGTIAVTATSMCDERKNPTSCDDEDWWGGNYDGELDVAAPGVRIASTDMLGNRGFAAGSYTTDFNGTSAACPNAAGVMALVLSARPELRATDARYILANTADKAGGYNYDQSRYAGTWSRELGFGRVNAYNAVQEAISYTSQSEQPIERIVLRIYPNPASLFFTAEFYVKGKSEITFTLSDVAGKTLPVFSFSESFMSGRNSISMAAPPNPGIYFLQLVSGNHTGYAKIISTGK